MTSAEKRESERAGEVVVVMDRSTRIENRAHLRHQYRKFIRPSQQFIVVLTSHELPKSPPRSQSEC